MVSIHSASIVRMTDYLVPHGPGFRFVDNVEFLENGKRVRATKYLSPTLPFFTDHFPGNPLMPGVLLIECAAQAAGCLWGNQTSQSEPEKYLLAQVLTFKLLRPTLPEQILMIEASLERDFGKLAQFSVEILESSELVANGRIVLAKQ